MHWRQRSGAGNALEGFGPVTLADTRCGQCNGGKDQVRAMHWGQRSGRCGKCTGGRDQVQVMHWRQRSGAGNALEAEIRCGQCTGGRDQVRAMHWRGLDL